MLWRNNSDILFKELLARCEEIINTAEALIKEYRSIANRWGKTHFYLGILTITSSSISAVFSFFSWPIISVTASLVSIISAFLITFLNPSDREKKRQSILTDLLICKEKTKNTIMLIKARP